MGNICSYLSFLPQHQFPPPLDFFIIYCTQQIYGYRDFHFLLDCKIYIYWKETFACYSSY